MSEMRPHQVWDAILGEQYGAAFRSALQLLSLIPPEEFQKAIRRIDTETSIGPILNPSAYVGGKRFENARKFNELLQHGFQLSRDLQAILKEEAGGE